MRVISSPFELVILDSKSEDLRVDIAKGRSRELEIDILLVIGLFFQLVIVNFCSEYSRADIEICLKC